MCHKHYHRFIRYGSTDEHRKLVDKSSKCKMESCQRTQQTNLGFCLMHYKRWKRFGTSELPERIDRTKIECKFCESFIGKHGAFGMCCKHYQMWRLHGNPLFLEIKRTTTKRGYFRDKDGEFVHRKVVEHKIGRKLIKQHEVIHHIDLDKFNNNPNNLIVLTKSTHASLHQQLNQIAGQLIRAKIIFFKDGKYHINF